MSDDYQQKLDQICSEFDKKMQDHKNYVRDLVKETKRRIELAQAEELAKSIKEQH